MYDLNTRSKPQGRSPSRFGASRPSHTNHKPYHRGGSKPQGGRRKFVHKSTADASKFVRKSTATAQAKLPEIKHRFVDFKFCKELEIPIA